MCVKRTVVKQSRVCIRAFKHRIMYYLRYYEETQQRQNVVNVGIHVYKKTRKN